MSNEVKRMRGLWGAVLFLLLLSALPAEVTPVTSMSKVSFADVNGDGLLDLVLGNYQQMDVYFNHGTASAPSFTTADRLIGITSGLGRVSGVFADLEYDGLMDIYFSTERGCVGLVRNTGTTSRPTWTSFAYQGTASSSFLGIWRDPYLNGISFIDLNGDGDLDMIVNDADSQLWYYMNQDKESDGWVDGTCGGGALTFVTLGYYERPLTSCGGNSARHTWTDWAGDGKFDLVSGDDGYNALRYYANTGTVTNPSFSSGFILNNIVSGAYISSFFSDFNADGAQDCYYTSSYGSLNFLSAVNRANAGDVDTLAPSLSTSGLVKYAVVDNNVTLKWPQVTDAAATGSSAYRSGVKYYALYRSTEGPDFTPSESNLLWKHYQFPHWSDYTPEFAGGDKFKIESGYFYYYDSAIVAGSTYCYKLQAVDYAGNVAETQSVCQTIDTPVFDHLDVTANPLNTNNAFSLTVTAYDQFGNPFLLASDGTNPNVTIKVYQGTPPAETQFVLIDASTSEPLTNQTFNGLASMTFQATIANENCIQFKVFASASHFSGGPAPETREKLSSQVSIDRSIPDRPAGLSVLNRTYFNITLGWGAVTDSCLAISSYKLYVKGPGQSSYSVTYNGSATSYTYTATPCQSYRFYVTAVDAGGNESLVTEPDTIALTATPTPDTSAPSAVTAFSGYYFNGESMVQLDWDPSTDVGSGIDKYEVQKKPDSVSDFSFLTFISSGTTDYVETQSYPGHAIWYRVRAIDKCGNLGAWSQVEVNTSYDTTPPSVPTGLVGTSPSSTSVYLIWNASTDEGTGVRGYKVYRNGAYQAETSSRAYTSTGLTPATTYNFQVSAVDNSNNESNKCTAVPVTTQSSSNKPNPPTGLNATDVQTTYLTLNWTAPTPNGVTISSYRVYSYASLDTPDGSGTLVATVSSTTALITGLTNGATYYYDVKAYSSGGVLSDPSNRISVTTGGSQTPTVPTNFHTTAIGSTTVDLAWDASTPSTGVTYKVCIAKWGFTGYYCYEQVASTTSLSCQVTTLTSGTAYDFIIKAVGPTALESAYSDPPLHVTTVASDTTAPTVPGNLQGDSPSTTTIQLSWTASTDTGGSGMDGYKIYRNNIFVLKVTTLTYTDTALQPSTVYHYGVSAIDLAGNESAKATVDVTTKTPDTTPPTVPGNLQGTPDLTSVQLSWTASTEEVGGSGFDGYKIYRNNVFLLKQTALTYNDTGLQNGTLYHYAVSAVDLAGNESTKATADVTTKTPDTTAPSVPGSFQGNSPDLTTVELSWAASTDEVGGSGLDGYKIYRNDVFVIKQTALTFKDDGLQSGTLYHYGVSAVDLAGNESAKATVEVKTKSPDNTPPSVPENLRATTVDTTHITLNWAASSDGAEGSGLDGYRVFRDGVFLTKVTGLTYSDKDLTEETVYDYQVSALDLAGNESEKCVAVPGVTASSKKSLYGAHIVSQVDWYSRLTLTNVGTTDNPIDLYAYNYDGAELQKVTIAALAAKAMLDADVSTLFDPSVFASGNNVWLRVASLSNLKGVITFGTKDNQSLTTIPLFDKGAPDLIFPYVYISNLYLTGITLINTGVVPADVSLTAYSESGDLLSTEDVVIEAGNKFVRLVNQAFPAVSEPNLIRFVKLQSTEPLIGFELFGSMTQKGWAGLPAFSPTVKLFSSDRAPDALKAIPEQDEEEPVSLTAPSTPTGLQGSALSDTQVYLYWKVNPETDIHHYEILNNDTPMPSLVGTSTTPGFTVNGLTANQSYSYSVKAVNNASEKSSATPPIVVTTLAPGQSDYPFKVVYNEIPNPDVYFTGITFSNIGSAIADAHLELYDKDGVMLGESDLVGLSPLAQATYDIKYFFNNVLPPGAAFLKVGSLQPILGFELYVTNVVGHPFQFEGNIGLPEGVGKIDFPLVKTGVEWVSSLRLSNPNYAQAAVTIQAYSVNGYARGTKMTTIPAYGKLDKTLEEMFPSTINEIGWISVLADQPLVGDIFIASADQTRLISYMGLDGSQD